MYFLLPRLLPNNSEERVQQATNKHTATTRLPFSLLLISPFLLSHRSPLPPKPKTPKTQQFVNHTEDLIFTYINRKRKKYVQISERLFFRKKNNHQYCQKEKILVPASVLSEGNKVLFTIPFKLGRPTAEKNFKILIIVN